MGDGSVATWKIRLLSFLSERGSWAGSQSLMPGSLQVEWMQHLLWSFYCFYCSLLKVWPTRLVGLSNLTISISLISNRRLWSPISDLKQTNKQTKINLATLRKRSRVREGRNEVAWLAPSWSVWCSILFQTTWVTNDSAITGDVISSSLSKGPKSRLG